MTRTNQLYIEAKKLIPGGTQLLSKRQEMFLPGMWPAYFKSAHGCEIIDLDDKHYLDMSLMGIGANILGYSDHDVDEKIQEVIKSGNSTTLNAPEEVELAQLLTKIHPWADMVRYARTGGEAMAIAVRIARAYSRKDIVLFCGYHGWHDWYLAANLNVDSALDGHLLPGLEPRGVPRSLTGMSYPFTYNNVEELKNLVSHHKGKIGAIALETVRNIEPNTQFLADVKEISVDNNIPLIADEISSGFRLNVGGAHLNYGLEPDISVFAKGISNGYPMAAIIGTEKVMQSAQTTFISSTYWTERIGPTAALATIIKMQVNNVPEHLIKIGKEVQDTWAGSAKKHQLNIKLSGIYPLSHFSFMDVNDTSLKTLYIKLMLERGILATDSFYASFAHKEEHVSRYLNAIDEVFGIISKAIKNNTVKTIIGDNTAHSGFKRLT